MSETRTKRRTVPDHAKAALMAVNAMLASIGGPGDGDWDPAISAADMEAAKRWLAAKLQPGGAWPKGRGKR